MHQISRKEIITYFCVLAARSYSRCRVRLHKSSFRTRGSSYCGCTSYCYRTIIAGVRKELQRNCSIRAVSFSSCSRLSAFHPSSCSSTPSAFQIRLTFPATENSFTLRSLRVSLSSLCALPKANLLLIVLSAA